MSTSEIKRDGAQRIFARLSEDVRAGAELVRVDRGPNNQQAYVTLRREDGVYHLTVVRETGVVLNSRRFDQ